MDRLDGMKATRRITLAALLAVGSFAGLGWAQTTDTSNGGTTTVRTDNDDDDQDDDDGFDWGLLGLLGLLGLAGLKRRDDHVRVHDTTRTGH